MADRDDLDLELSREWRELVESTSTAAASSPTSLEPGARLPLRRTALYAELEDVRVSWRELSPGITRYAERYVNAGWTVRQLVAHLAAWAKEFREEVETVSRGDAFDYAIPFALSVVGPTQWNAEQVQARRGQSVEELLEELDRETRRLQDLVLTIDEPSLYGPASFPHAPSGDPSQRWRGTNAIVILGRCQHDRHHLRHLRERIRAFSEKE